MSAYASVEEYRIDTGDTTSDSERIGVMLQQQSAKLRAIVGISSNMQLDDDQRALARLLVTDSVRKALIVPSVEGMDAIYGVKQSSFSADGFQTSYTMANPSGAAYFDNATLKALKRTLKRSQRIGMIMPSYGGRL